LKKSDGICSDGAAPLSVLRCRFQGGGMGIMPGRCRFRREICGEPGSRAVLAG
jgi:hypothetical protein